MVLFGLSTVAVGAMSVHTSIPMLVPLTVFGLGYSCIPGSLWCVDHVCYVC